MLNYQPTILSLEELQEQEFESDPDQDEYGWVTRALESDPNEGDRTRSVTAVIREQNRRLGF
jgi:hypothetical protein